MAKVLSSISGNLISAASAGYAPTNSADVSAIASGYQVVSSTATQLYAGTAYLTDVNGDPISASRAGQAANASMATSAYYDGTGRLISSLPDSAAVSSIASSYAESAASSKADSSALSAYAFSSNVSGVIDTVSSNSASWGAGATLPITGSTGDDSASYGGGSLEFTRYDTAGEPDIRTATLTPDSLWLNYTLDGNDYTSMSLTESMLDFTDSDGDHIVDAYSIDTWNSAVDTVANNSASWGGGATGNYVETSATEVAIGSANLADYTSLAQGSSNTATYNSFAQGSNNSADGDSLAQGYENSARTESFAQGMDNYGESYSFAHGGYNYAYYNSFAQGRSNSALDYSFAQGRNNSASGFSFAQGYENSAINTAAVFGQYNLSGDGDTATGNSAAFAIGDGTAWDARHDLMLVTKDGEITMFSSTADTAGLGLVSSIKAISAAATGGGGDYVEKSATEVAIGSANTASSIAFTQGSGNSAFYDAFAQGELDSAFGYSFAQGWQNLATGLSFVQGSNNSATVYSFAQGFENNASGQSFAQGEGNSAVLTAFAQGVHNMATGWSFAQGYENSADNNSFTQGESNSAKNTAAVFGKFNLSGDGDTSTGNSAAFAIGDGTAWDARHDLMLVTKDGEITMFSSTADTAGTGIMSSIRAISAAATGGGVDSATVSAIASSYAESSVSSKQDSSAMSAYALSSDVSGVIDTVSANSASWTTDLTDYATTAYVDSSVSSKLDSSASSSFYTTANESGYVGSAYVDSAVSGKMDTFSAGEGLEFVQSGSDQVLQVEAPVDIVAGPGIVIDNPDGNTLRVSVAQAQFTELYYNATNTNDTAGKVYQLSEPITNFAYAKITVDNMEFANNPLVYEIDVQHNTTTCNWISPLRNGNLDNTINLPACRLKINSDGNLILDGRSLTYNTYPSPQNTSGASRGFRVVRVVGIFRISGGN